eukprot:scaffold73915_cov31-Prasinocladus_malaysianus.AAC.1
MPWLGTIKRSDGLTLSKEHTPVISQHAAFLPNYDPDWGPSWSRQEHCNFGGGGGTSQTCPCQFRQYTIETLLGPPDAFPSPGISPLGYGTNVVGEFFVVIGINIPVHISSVK